MVLFALHLEVHGGGGGGGGPIGAEMRSKSQKKAFGLYFLSASGIPNLKLANNYGSA
jgi:hypothetical protein